MLVNVGLFTLSVRMPPDEIVLVKNCEVAVVVPPVNVTAPPELTMFPVLDTPKFMS